MCRQLHIRRDNALSLSTVQSATNTGDDSRWLAVATVDGSVFLFKIVFNSPMLPTVVIAKIYVFIFLP